MLLAVETINGCGGVAESHASAVYPCASEPFLKELTSPFRRLCSFCYGGFSVAGVAEEVDVSKVTVVDWFMRYREIYARYLLKTSQPIGGPENRRNRRAQV